MTLTTAKNKAAAALLCYSLMLPSCDAPPSEHSPIKIERMLLLEGRIFILANVDNEQETDQCIRAHLSPILTDIFIDQFIVLIDSKNDILDHSPVGLVLDEPDVSEIVVPARGSRSIKLVSSVYSPEKLSSGRAVKVYLPLRDCNSEAILWEGAQMFYEKMASELPPSHRVLTSADVPIRNNASPENFGITLPNE